MYKRSHENNYIYSMTVHLTSLLVLPQLSGINSVVRLCKFSLFGSTGDVHFKTWHTTSISKPQWS